MENSIEVLNRTKRRIDADFVKKNISKTLKLSEARLSDFSISVVFLEKGEISKLNREYRRKSGATDILSFIYNSGYNKRGKMLEGELALCPETIASQAKENKVAFRRELAFVLSHGILHLLGFRHGKKMCAIQDKVSSKFKDQNEK